MYMFVCAHARMHECVHVQVGVHAHKSVHVFETKLAFLSHYFFPYFKLSIDITLSTLCTQRQQINTRSLSKYQSYCVYMVEIKHEPQNPGSSMSERICK